VDKPVENVEKCGDQGPRLWEIVDQNLGSAAFRVYVLPANLSLGQNPKAS